MKLTHKIVITPEMILDAKKNAAEHFINRIKESQEHQTDFLRDICSVVKDDKVYIMSGLNIIAII